MTIRSEQSQSKQSAEQIAQMMRKLLHYAKQARRIEIDQERIAFFIYQMIESNYSTDLYDRAKIWILHGDWRFRGNDPTLQFDDLFPSDDQVRETIARMKSNLVILDRSEYQRTLKSTFDAGFREGQSKSRVAMTQEQVQQLKEVMNQWTK